MINGGVNNGVINEGVSNGGVSNAGINNRGVGNESVSDGGANKYASFYYFCTERSTRGGGGWGS